MKALAVGRPVGKTGPMPTMTAEEREVSQRKSDRRSYARHAEERKARARAKDAERRAAVAAAEGREVRKPGRPKVERTAEETRELRRVKTAAWREANVERSREITRESEKRRAAARALAEGRDPGKRGPPKRFTDEEIAVKRLAISTRNYYANHEENREKAARRAREIRAEKAAGIFVSRKFSPLTPEQKRQSDVRFSQKRRARLLAAIGGGYTGEDLNTMRRRQENSCNLCGCELNEANETLDHVLPLALGGAHNMSNFQLLCGPCNYAKGAKHPSGFKFRTSVKCE